MNYEKRDHYFTRLKFHLETAKKTSGGLKTVLLSHSMGSQVLYYFFHWVEAEGYGNGGSSWVNDHVEAWINISGCMLGALKDVPAVLSGEMRDTAQLNALAVYGLEKFLSRQERADIFRQMPGISYGIGKPTERAYYYREEMDSKNSTFAMIDTSVNIGNGFVDRGVVMGEGDGTVNLLSTGYMCNRGWKMKRYNPANIPITVFEMPHEPDRFSPRGGANTGDHVDILGRSSLNELILKVAGGKGDQIEENVVSNIKEYAAKVKIYDDEGDA